MGNVYATLFRDSSVPGLSTIFGTHSKSRKFILTLVFVVLTFLTVKDLFIIVVEYFQFPITVSVLVADSRVLPFPAVTVCNLNAVHRGRYCSNKDIMKPENIEKILCASLNDLLDVCKIHEVLDDLVKEGERICLGKKKERRKGARKTTKGTRKPGTRSPRRTGPGNRRGPRRPGKSDPGSFNSSGPFGADDIGNMLPEPVDPGGGLEYPETDRRSRDPRHRGKRDIEFNFKTLMQTFRALQAGNLTGGLFAGLTEAGGMIDTVILHVASLYGINVNSTKQLLPALFVKAFTEVTGCRVGAADKGDDDDDEEPASAEMPRFNNDPINDALENLTAIFAKTGCIWKAPKLLKLFQKVSEQLITQLTTCTGPWVSGLLGVNETTSSSSETPWFILLDLMQSWMADLSRKHPDQAKLIGHQAKDMIKSCYFAGKKCNIERDFQSEFYSQHGNCFSYNTDEVAAEVLQTGFTGPQFGLELTLTLETESYMPTSKEAGLKIVVHDRWQKADPDQDAVNVPPGVITYLGVQMLNITRLKAPFQDKCTDDWPEGEMKKWALALNHDTYTTQTCLKICLQQFVIKRCRCWTQTAPWPPFAEEPQCSERRNKAQATCVEYVREMYFKEKIDCSCPPRCSDRIYEKFLSTGHQTRQCSAIPSDTDGDHGSQNKDDKDNHAKVIVYFHSLSLNEIRQEKKYTVEGLLGAIGGILGVYLGVSFFAIYEVFEVMIRGCFRSGENAKQEPETPRRPMRRKYTPYPYQGGHVTPY
ncbi:Degenerin mec-4 [Halotydeus destructor]|nr:Degenerin mec-4 [Halotydeus destructor]